MKCETRPIDGPNGLPFYISQGKVFHEVRVFGVCFLLVSFVGANSLRWQTQKKILGQIEIAANMPVAYGFDTLNEMQRKGLVEAKIPYVSATSFFLPFLGIAYRKQRKASSKNKLEKGVALSKLTSAAQAFFLFMMYKVKDSKISKSEAARQNNLTPMSVSRYCRELLDRGLINETKEGNSTLISCSEIGRLLFDKALPYLDSPIKKEIILFPSQAFKSLPKAGETALSEVSMLAPPKESLAACGPHADLAKEKGLEIENLGFFKNSFVRLQIWKYDPAPFAMDRRIDIVSLYLSLKDSPNERVQACLKEMLEKAQW